MKVRLLFKASGGPICPPGNNCCCPQALAGSCPSLICTAISACTRKEQSGDRSAEEEDPNAWFCWPPCPLLPTGLLGGGSTAWGGFIGQEEDHSGALPAPAWGKVKLGIPGTLSENSRHLRDCFLNVFCQIEHSNTGLLSSKLDIWQPYKLHSFPPQRHPQTTVIWWHFFMCAVMNSVESQESKMCSIIINYYWFKTLSKLFHPGFKKWIFT